MSSPQADDTPSPYGGSPYSGGSSAPTSYEPTVPAGRTRSSGATPARRTSTGADAATVARRTTDQPAGAIALLVLRLTVAAIVGIHGYRHMRHLNAFKAQAE